MGDRRYFWTIAKAIDKFNQKYIQLLKFQKSFIYIYVSITVLKTPHVFHWIVWNNNPRISYNSISTLYSKIRPFVLVFSGFHQSLVFIQSLISRYHGLSSRKATGDFNIIEFKPGISSQSANKDSAWLMSAI